MEIESPFVIRPHRVTGGGKAIVIWGETEKLEIFLSGIDSAPITVGVPRTVRVEQHTVRRYPGDPGYTRKAHNRTFDPDIGLQGGITPGRPFWIEDFVLTDDLAAIGIDSYQFSLQGPFYALKAYCRANATQDFRLRTAGGRAHLIQTGE